MQASSLGALFYDADAPPLLCPSFSRVSVMIALLSFLEPVA